MKKAEVFVDLFGLEWNFLIKLSKTRSASIVRITTIKGQYLF